MTKWQPCWNKTTNKLNNLKCIPCYNYNCSDCREKMLFSNVLSSAYWNFSAKSLFFDSIIVVITLHWSFTEIHRSTWLWKKQVITPKNVETVKIKQNHMIGSRKPHGYRYLPIWMWMSCYHEIITSVSGLPTLLVISTRTIGCRIRNTKQQSWNCLKTYLLFCLKSPLLQVSLDTSTSGINSTIKIQ